MRRGRLVGLAIAAVVVAGSLWYRSRNPEHLTLDAAARVGVPGRFLTLSGGVTHFDVTGPDTGRRVLLIHGFSVPYYIWDSTVAALTAGGFRVARYDTFGRGWSDRPAIRYTPALFVAQAAELLDSLGWREPVDVIGLSLGGPVGAGLTGLAPARVRTLTLVDPAAAPPGRVATIFRLPVVGPALWQVLAVPGMAASQTTDFVEPARWPDWPDHYRTQTRYRGFGRALLSTLREREGVTLDSVYARVGAAGTPTLLIWGMEDRTVPIDYADGVRSAIPQAEYHPIERAGHLPVMERTDVVNPLLIAFLRAH